VGDQAVIGVLLAYAVSIATPPYQRLDGAVDPDCTVEKVCQPGYTQSVRPDVQWTDVLKENLMIADHLPGMAKDYELDHFIPLELCGAPASLQNLWMEPIKEARIKDKDETRLHRMVCKGQMNLEEAQQGIRTKWKIHD
jgi:hypothetical protein